MKENEKINIEKHIRKNITAIRLNGPSGSGKTTLLHILAGNKIYNGMNLSINNKFNHQININYFKNTNNIFFLGQYNTQIPGYIFEILCAGIDINKLNKLEQNELNEMIIEILSNLNILETILNFPNGIREYLEPNTPKLSGGQFQRLRIAQMLIRIYLLKFSKIKKKRIVSILLDEFTASLDKENSIKTQNLVLKILRKIIKFHPNIYFVIFYITHSEIDLFKYPLEDMCVFNINIDAKNKSIDIKEIELQ